MNCKQVEEALAQFVAGELEDRREREIAQHLPTCVNCAAVAGEYRESRELLQDFAPPVFGDDVYAEMRRNVWRQIEAMPQRASLRQVFGSWLRPQVSWAVAMTLLIALSALAIYFIRKDQDRPVQFASNPVPTHERAVVNTPTPLSPSKREREKHQAGSGRIERRHDLRRAPDRTPSVALNSPDAKSIGSQANPQADGSFDPSALRDSGEKLRLEMQTRNPNIRIIWFTQKEPKSAGPHSKGT